MASDAHVCHRRNAASRLQVDDDYAKANRTPQANGTPQKTKNDTSYDIQKEERSARRLPINSHSGTFVHATVCIGWLIYIGVRFQMCLQASVNPPHMHWGLWLLFVCEIILAGPELFQIIELSLSFIPGKNPALRPCYRLDGDDAPSVHVFITTCGEDLEIIMDTVVGAALQDYPKHCYRVFVLNDASDSNIKREIDAFNETECERLGIQPVIYLTRSKEIGVLHYHKAGNLDFGIRTSNEQYGSSDMIAGLDADMIPENDWLKRSVPHLVCSPEVALVSPPQYSYNIPEGDVLAQDANVLQQILEPVRDRIGCSMCHGSGYVMRREALDAIGGWPLVNLGEDILCSYQLNRDGWQTAFIKDKLQFGMAPDSFHAYVAQRMRWTAGNLLSAKKSGFFLPFLNRSKITGAQRFHGMMQAVKTYAWVALIVPLLAVPTCLPFFGNGGHYGEVFANRNFVRCVYIVTWGAFKVWKRMVFAHLGATNTFNLSRNRYWITPYIVYSYQSIYVNLEETKFTISGTFESPVNERSRNSRPGLWTRLTNSLVLMHALYWLISLVAFLAWIFSIGQRIVSGSQPHAYLHTGVTVRLFETVLAALVPLRYMAYPPSGVDRRKRLTRDDLGAYRAVTKTWSKRGDNVVFVKDLVELLIIIMCDWL